MDMTIVAILSVLGLTFGSFAGAQVWRLRSKQLVDDKAAGEPYDKSEYARLEELTRHKGAHDRSRCLSCHHVLSWYDLIPLYSWLTLRGRCRYCRKPIGIMEPLIEVGMVIAFVLSYYFWPYELGTPLEWAMFGLWLVACVLMAVLFAYDARWSLLPFGINLALVAVSAVFLTVSMVISPFDGSQWLSLIGSLLILAGLYFVFSLPGWVGLGDSILGLGLAMLLITWERAFLALFLANLLGSLTIVPLAIQGKLKRGTHVPFGPFMILACYVSLLWGSSIISVVFDWSTSLMNSLMV